MVKLGIQPLRSNFLFDMWHVARGFAMLFVENLYVCLKKCHQWSIFANVCALLSFSGFLDHPQPLFVI